MINVCIIGTGNIGTDLLYKLLKLDHVNIVAFIGRRENTKILPSNVKYSDESIQFFIKNHKCCNMVFDCTDANSALINSKIFMDQGIKVIDLTPSNIGTMYIPYITPISDYMNMVTCGGQSSIPLINFIHKQCSDIKYIEVVTQISAESAGMATRINIDKYIETTENAIYNLTGLKNNKVILNVNPGKKVIMKTTIYIKTPQFTINNLDLFVNNIKKYITNYNLSPPVWLNDNLLLLHIKIIGNGDYISEYAGNLDIINCAAICALNEYNNINSNNFQKNTL